MDGELRGEELERRTDESETDAVERRRFEQERCETREEFRTFSEFASDCVYWRAPNKTILYIAPPCLQVTGHSPDEFYASPELLDSLVHPDDRLLWKNHSHPADGDRSPKVLQHRIVTKQGETRWVTHVCRCVCDKAGTFLGVRGSYYDITEFRRAEQALREHEQRCGRITETLRDSLFTVRIENGHPVQTIHSPASVAVTGYTPEECSLDPNAWIQMVHEEDRAAFEGQVARVLSGQETQPLEHRIRRKDGLTCWVRTTLVPHYDSQGNLLSYDGLVLDLSEQKRLEAGVRQGQKMEAIGTLAGGIAHDFNNILAAIVGYTQLAREDVPEDRRVQANLEEVLKAALRAKDLVRQILTFSRQKEEERTPLSIGSLVKEALRMLRASLPTTVEIRQHIKCKSDFVLADPTQIHQVLMNLCANAAHAMRERGGVLGISLEDIDVDSDAAGKHPDLEPGPYVNLTVSDTGCGMTPGVREKIFDPYFTTKKTGEGTGMGLAVVQGIVKSYQGSIEVHSEPGKGTTFRVFLPRIESPVKPETKTPDVVPEGSERILFVDDEAALANLGKYMLERLGYQVESKTSSIEALEAFREQPDRFDLLITDMTMPNMTGTELAREITGIRPKLPVVICSGYSDLISEEKAKAMDIREFIMKPVIKRDIARAVRRVLDQE